MTSGDDTDTEGTRGHRLRLHRPPEGQASRARWMVNGYPAEVLTWTAEEWGRLRERPGDTQAGPNGVRVALRFA